MIDAIFIAQTGLHGFQFGLRTIANNTANMNTPGFKGQFAMFGNMFYGQGSFAGSAGLHFGSSGNGLATLGTAINFQQGQLQTTNNPLDLALNGPGFFTLRDTNGNIHYTQDGQFKWDSDGVLVSASNGEQVMAFDSGGNMVLINKNEFSINPGKATTTITFSGNLDSIASTGKVDNVIVFDAAGNKHTLSVNFEKSTDPSTPTTWAITLKEGTTVVSSVPPQTVVFSSGIPTVGTISINSTLAGLPTLTLDWSGGVSSQSGTTNLYMLRQDGYSYGAVSGFEFDASGVLQVSYDNGQKSPGKQLALAQYRSVGDVEEIGNNEFAAKSGSQWLVGRAGVGQFGKVQSSAIEMSNVDLSSEFSNLVIMQRGYQACSQIVSTSNDMLSVLFNMWNK